jgi:hypothetical protein
MLLSVCRKGASQCCQCPKSMVHREAPPSSVGYDSSAIACICWARALHNAYSSKTMGFFSVPRLPGLFFQRLVYGGVLPPPHSLRQAQGCGFPHTQVAKRTAPSRQSLQKSPSSFSAMTGIVTFCKGLLGHAPVRIIGPNHTSHAVQGCRD